MTAKKRKPGRPTIGDKAALFRIAFRVTAEQRERYSRAATLAGVSLTVWIERQLDRTAK